MFSVIEALVPQLSQSFDTIVHIGAGNGVGLDAYERIRYRRVVLVEGDPQALPLLRACAGNLPGAEVMEAVVGVDSGAATWFGCSVSALNGLVDPRLLRSIFPRLRILSEEPVQPLPMAELLHQIGIESQPGRLNLLVLDVPGLEDALINAVPDAMLAAFAHVVILGCSALARPDTPPMQAALRRLAQRHFRPRVVNAETQPQWPLEWMEFDPALSEIDDLRRSGQEQADRIQALYAEVDLLRADRATLRQALKDAQLASEARAAAAQAELKSVVDDRAGQIETLHAERATLAGEVAALQGELRALREARAEFEARAAAAQSDLESVANERALYIEQLQSEEARLKGTMAVLQGELSTLKEAHDASEARALAAQSELNSLVEDRARDIAILHAEQAALQETVSRLQADLSALREAQEVFEGHAAAAKSALESVADERARDIEMLQSEQAALKESLAMSQLELSNLREAHQASEARAGAAQGALESVADERARYIEMLHAERDTLHRDIAGFQREASALHGNVSALGERLREAEAHAGSETARSAALRGLSERLVQAWHEQRSAEAHAHQAETAALTDRIDGLSRAQDEHSSRSTQIERELGGLRQQLAELTQRNGLLQEQLALAQAEGEKQRLAGLERLGRSRKFQDQMLKAEAQVDLIKDLLLRGDGL